MSWLQLVSKWSLISLCLLYLAAGLFYLKFEVITGILGIIILLSNITLMGDSFRKASWAFLGIGGLVLLIRNEPPTVWFQGINSMLKTVAIVVIMQSFSIPLQLGKYELAVTGFLAQYAKKENKIFLFMVFFSHLLASFLNLGAVIISLSLINPVLATKIKNYPRFLARAICRGYSTVFLWAPGTVTVLMVIQIFDLTWRQYFMPALLLTGMGMLIAVLIELPSLSSHELKCPELGDSSPGSMQGKILQLLAALLVLLAFIMVMEYFQLSDSIGRLLISGSLVAGIWASFYRDKPEFQTVIKNYWNQKIPQSGDLATFFIAMGVFSVAARTSGMIDLLLSLAHNHAEGIGRFVLWLLPLIITGFSLVGVHPFVSMLMLGTFVVNLPTGATHLQMGLSMALGCVISYVMSPFAGLTLTMSKYMGLTPEQISFRWNSLYALIFYVLGTLFIAHFS